MSVLHYRYSSEFPDVRVQRVSPLFRLAHECQNDDFRRDSETNRQDAGSNAGGHEKTPMTSLDEAVSISPTEPRGHHEPAPDGALPRSPQTMSVQTQAAASL